MYKMCFDYMLEVRKTADVSTWKITKKSVVWYDFDNVRHVVPISKICGE